MDTIKKRSFTALIIAILCGAFCILLAGCASSNLQIGSDADKSSVAMTNKTGQAITGVAVKTAAAEDFSADLEQRGDWKNDTTADIHYANQENSEDTADDGFTMRLTTADGMTYELHQLDLATIKDASIHLDSDLAYLEYTNTNTGESVNTLDAEKAYKEQKEAEEAAAKQAAAEQAAREKAAQEQAEQAKKAEQSQKNSGSSSNASSGSSSDSSSKGSSDSKPSSNNASSPSSSPKGSSDAEDTCVDDLVFNK